jgi:hypothetical protein
VSFLRHGKWIRYGNELRWKLFLKSTQVCVKVCERSVFSSLREFYGEIYIYIVTKFVCFFPCNDILACRDYKTANNIPNIPKEYTEYTKRIYGIYRIHRIYQKNIPNIPNIPKEYIEYTEYTKRIYQKMHNIVMKFVTLKTLELRHVSTPSCGSSSRSVHQCFYKINYKEIKEFKIY